LITGNFELVKQMGASVADTVKIKQRIEILDLHPDVIECDPEQPRKEFGDDGLARLADSLRKHGQLQPVIVKLVGKKYVLVTGERRVRAAKMAGKHVQAVLWRKGDARSLQLIENLLRDDLKPVEQAKAFAEVMKKEGWSLREIARQLCLDHSKIAKALKLLELPKKVQAAVDKGDIPATTAYEIARRPKAEQKQLAQDAAAGKIRGEDLRKPATPRPAPRPTLTFGKPDVSHDWDYQFGKIHVSVTGYRDKKGLVTALERALASARAARFPLSGGHG
jgi:ParB family chromosome partitioning protein